MPGTQITKREELEAWLREKPQQCTQVVAHRAAMRALPVIEKEWEQDISVKLKRRRTLAVFRANFIARYQVQHPLVEIPQKIMRTALAEVASVSTNAASPQTKRVAASATSALSSMVHKFEGEQFSRYASRAVTASLHLGFPNAHIWEAVSSDLTNLDSRISSPVSLLKLPLWPQTSSSIKSVEKMRLSLNASALYRLIDSNESVDWSHWFNWYTGAISQYGGPVQEYFGEDLSTIIAYKPDSWWQRDPEIVNTEISDLIKEDRSVYEEYISSNSRELMSNQEKNDYFLSYSFKDVEMARQITEIIESTGRKVFAQFKEMVPGSNFVREMQRGIGESSRLIALYSPDYERSDQCQAEWSAAYNADPSGKERKILPFLIRPTELNPLARQVVYTNLVGLKGDELRQAVLGAISLDVVKKRAKPEFVQRAIELASPVLAEKRENGFSKIDVASNPKTDDSFSEGELHELPNLQCKIIDVLVESLPGNAPKVVKLSLGRYEEHLKQRGIRPFTTLLRIFANSVQIEYQSSESELWGDGLNNLFAEFFKYHSLFMQHFPLADRIERLVDNTEFDHDSAMGPALSEPMETFQLAAGEASDAGLTTIEFDRAVDVLAEQGSELAKNPSVGINKAVKRYVIVTIGFVGALYTFLGSTASIVSTPQGQALMTAAQGAMDKLLAFIR